MATTSARVATTVVDLRVEMMTTVVRSESLDGDDSGGGGGGKIEVEEGEGRWLDK